MCVLFQVSLIFRTIPSSPGSNFQVFITLLLNLFSCSCGSDEVFLQDFMCQKFALKGVMLGKYVES